MSQPGIRPEEIADFLTGKLGPRERDDLIARLANSRDGREMLIDAEALMREEDAAPDIEPPPPPPDPKLGPSDGKPSVRGRFRGWWFAPLGIAAVAAIAFFRMQGSQGSFDPSTPLIADAGGAAMTRLLGENWDAPQWSGTRGATDVMADPSRAARLGVLAAQFLRAGAMRDSAAVRTTARPLADLAREVPAGSAVARLLLADSASIAFASRSETDRLVDALRALSEPPAWFDLGVWLETARQAARANQLHGQQAKAAEGRLVRLMSDVTQPNTVDDDRYQRLRRLLEDVRVSLAANHFSDRELAAIDSAIADAAR